MYATTETKNTQDSSMCPNFNLNRSISSETTLKQHFKCKITNLSFMSGVMVEENSALHHRNK